MTDNRQPNKGLITARDGLTRFHPPCNEDFLPIPAKIHELVEIDLDNRSNSRFVLVKRSFCHGRSVIHATPKNAVLMGDYSKTG